MQKVLSLLILVALCGCATPEPTRRGPHGEVLKPNDHVVHIESNPTGARIFFGVGANEDQAERSRSYIGTAPFDWIVEGRGNGEFKIDGAFVYSMVVPPAAVFMAEPTATNLFTKRQVFHTGTAWTAGDKIPTGLFFDNTKQ